MAAANGESDETSGLATPLNHELAQGAYGNASFVCQRKSSLVTQRLPKAVCMGPCHSLRCSLIFRQLKQHKFWCVNRFLQQSKHILESMVQGFLRRLTPGDQPISIQAALCWASYYDTGGIDLMLLFN
jgi:hypothetical protein